MAITTDRSLTKPSGPAAAVMLAAGVGSLVLGLMTTLSEASTAMHDFLEWSSSVGPLSGKTSIATAAFFASWIVLHILLRNRNPRLGPVFWLTLVLVALGILGTLPTFFQLFAPEG